MRTTVIPAQITTVEDKIAGNLNLTQVFILMVPVFFGTAVYVLTPPFFRFAIYKIAVISIVTLISLLLSLRIKGKVVANWLGVLLRYNLRPKYYVFNKNEAYLREVYLPKTAVKLHKKAVVKNNARANSKNFIKDVSKLERYLKNPKYALTLKPNRKGGVYVALNEIEQ